MKKQTWIYAGVFLAGVVLSGQARRIPVVGPKIPVI